MAQESRFEYNACIVMLRKSGVSLHDIIKAFTCTKCGVKPDRRNIEKTYKKYAEKYGRDREAN